jgi:prepilin-type N-terminal cleavage/methylation domain-containing protein
MASASKTKSARGFSLLEVLIAVVILSVGLLALASLQLSMIRASGATKAQTLATDLAKDKIEFLRSFRTINDYRLLTSAASPGTTDPVLTDGGTGRYGGVDYTRQYLITRYVYNKLPAGTPGFAVVGNTLTDAQLIALKDATHDYSIGKDFKLIKVTVSWADPTGATPSVTMEDIVDGLDPTESASLVKSTANTSGPRTLEEKITDPALDNMVIPIALGGGVDSAATNPKPTVVVGGNTVETRFDVLTYAGVNGGQATAQQKVETVMVGCTCTLDSPVASTVRGKRPTYWIGNRYATPVDVATSGSESYSPPGKTDPASAALQSAHCDICCRDHVDPAGVTGATFSPRLVVKDSGGIVTTPHRHYLDKTQLATNYATSGTYKEACRLIRVDGFWRVAADLENDYFGLLATGDGSNASSYAPDSTSVAGTPSVTGAIARYQNFVLAYMDERFVNPSPVPAVGAEQATYNSVTTASGPPATLAGSVKFVLNNPSTVVIDSGASGSPVCTVITGVTNANPAVVTHSATYTDCAGNTIAGPAYVNGDRVYITGVAGMGAINNAGSSYTVANVTPTTFQLSGVDTSVTIPAVYNAYTSGGVAEVSHGKWLHSRGLYVDYLEKEATDAITAAKADTTCSATPTALSLCVLRLLPFTSINLTEIADWDSADTSKAIVTNNNYSQTLTRTEPVRGETSFAGGADGSTVDVSSRSRSSNSGLLDLSFDSISLADDVKAPDAQTFRISNTVVTPKPGNGTFYAALSLAAKAGQGVNYITGTLASKACNNYVAAATSYPCVVNNAESTTIAPFDAEDAGLSTPNPIAIGSDTHANSMSIEVVGYNSTGTVTSTADINNCTGPFGPKVYTSVTSGNPNNRSNPASYTLNTCTTYDVTNAQKTLPLPVVNANGAAPYTVTGNGTLAEKTRINFAQIYADPNTGDATYVDKVTVTFGAPTTTTRTVGTCTYACTAFNNSNTDCADYSSTAFTITSTTCP